MVVRISEESEFCIITHKICELIWLKRILEELRKESSALCLF